MRQRGLDILVRKQIRLRLLIVAASFQGSLAAISGEPSRVECRLARLERMAELLSEAGELAGVGHENAK